MTLACEKGGCAACRGALLVVLDEYDRCMRDSEALNGPHDLQAARPSAGSRRP